MPGPTARDRTGAATFVHNSEQARKVHYQAETIGTSRDLFSGLKQKEEESRTIEFMDAVIAKHELSGAPGPKLQEAI